MGVYKGKGTRMREARLNLLFTSVGRRVELMRVFRQAYEKLGLGGRIVATDIDPLAPALKLVDRWYIVPRTRQADFIPAIADICRGEAIDVVFPLIDPDIPVLAGKRRTIEATGAGLGVVSEESALVTSDKWLTTRFFQDLQLPVADSWLASDLNGQRLEYPLVIKPRKGSAAQNVFKVSTPEELRFFSKYVPDAIVQEFLPGPEITNDVICDLQGEVLAVVSRQRIEVRWGEVAKGVTIYNPTITEACVRIAKALPAVGPITVQCMMKDGVAHFTEINARFGGGAPLGIAAGADWPTWLLARLADIPIEVPPLGSYQKGLYLTRFDESFFLQQSELKSTSDSSGAAHVV